MSLVRIIPRDRADTLGEGALWSARDGAVLWVDILGRRVNRLRLADDAVESWAMPDVVGWAIPRARGGFVAGVGRSVVTLDLDPLAIRPLADLAGEPDDNRVNDAKADPAGRVFFGTMPFDCERPVGSLWRLDPDGTVTRLVRDYTIPNGPAIDPAGRWLLQTDTARGLIRRYPILADGGLGEPAEWLRFDPSWGAPDGMTIDAEGGVWIACWGGSCVRRFDADGRFDRKIDLPASQITSCTFAGADLDRMFVTSAGDGVDEAAGGALFEVDPGVRGLPTRLFQG